MANNWREFEIIAQKTDDPEYLEERKKEFIRRVKFFDYSYFQLITPKTSKGRRDYIMWYDENREAVIFNYDKETFFSLSKTELYKRIIRIPDIPAYKNNYELFWDDLWEEIVDTARMAHHMLPMRLCHNKPKETIPNQDELLRDLAVKLQEIEEIIKELTTVNN